MLFKTMLTTVTGIFTLIIAVQNRIDVNLQIFGWELPVPLIALLGGFLMIGFLVGRLWRHLPHHHRKNGKIPLIRADMRVNRY